MKRFLFTIIALSSTIFSFAQQKPQYTQYLANQYIINPAIAGIENYTDIKLSHRLQWQGLTDAPVTSYFTIHGPIGKQDEKTTATSFGNPGQNPRGVAYWESYEASKPHHGWGVQVINDKIGPLSNLAAYATYAFHTGISPRTNLSAGISGGVSKVSLNADKLQFATQVDPAVMANGNLNKMNLDVNAGLYLYSADYFIGVSALQIVPQKIVWRDNVVKQEDGKIVPHFFATAGYRFSAGDDWNITPSVLIKYVSPVPPQIDLNSKFQYLDKFWFGVGYRHKDGFNGMAGLLISNRLNVSYSYDYTISKLNNYTRGSHELILGFLIGNKGESCPTNVW